MATEVTPSKTVYCYCPNKDDCRCELETNDAALQAASAIEGFKMTESPVKKLDFTIDNKENAFIAVPIAGIPHLPEAVKDDAEHPSIAPTIRAEEADEPLLQENPQRFVLFPIQHHEVSLRPTTRPNASNTVSR